MLVHDLELQDVGGGIRPVEGHSVLDVHGQAAFAIAERDAEADGLGALETGGTIADELVPQAHEVTIDVAEFHERDHLPILVLGQGVVEGGRAAFARGAAVANGLRDARSIEAEVCSAGVEVVAVLVIPALEH
jgi:hypothetical protein